MAWRNEFRRLSRNSFESFLQKVQHLPQVKQAVRWCRYELATPEYRDYSQTKWSNVCSKYFVLLIALLYTSVESMVEQALDIEVYESIITKDIMFGNSLLGCLERGKSGLVESRPTLQAQVQLCFWGGGWGGGGRGGLRYFGLKLERPAGASWCQVGLKSWQHRWGPQWSTSPSQCWIQMAMWPSKHLIIWSSEHLIALVDTTGNDRLHWTLVINFKGWSHNSSEPRSICSDYNGSNLRGQYTIYGRRNAVERNTNYILTWCLKQPKNVSMCGLTGRFTITML